MPPICIDCKKRLDPLSDGTRCFHCAASPWHCWGCARKHFMPIMPNEVHDSAGTERERIIRLIEDEQVFLSAEDKRLLVERIRD